MRPTITAALRILSSTLLLILLVNVVSSRTPSPPLPNPVLVLVAVEYYETGGKQFTRYQYQIMNFEDYPNALFAAAPALPPCGNNHNSSRTWVDFYDSRGKRLYGFCSLSKNSDLNSIWFALESDVIPPSYVYVEFNDRQTNTKYKSNLADTVQ